MSKNADEILEKVKQVDLKGILNVGKDRDRDNKDYITVDFWRIRGALKKDKSMKITMIIDPDNPSGDLLFSASNLNQCDARDLDLTIYMDANHNTNYGAHCWNPNTKKINFRYLLPLSDNDEDFPDVETYQRLLKDIYEGLLLHEIKRMEFRIEDDDFLDDDEKANRRKKIYDIFSSLISYENDDDEAI